MPLELDRSVPLPVCVFPSRMAPFGSIHHHRGQLKQGRGYCSCCSSREGPHDRLRAAERSCGLGPPSSMRAPTGVGDKSPNRSNATHKTEREGNCCCPFFSPLACPPPAAPPEKEDQSRNNFSWPRAPSTVDPTFSRRHRRLSLICEPPRPAPAHVVRIDVCVFAAYS